jgi:hypothetical protein
MNLPICHPIEKIVYTIPNLTDCVYVAQPYGKQCYAWFTDKCIFIDRRSKRQTIVPVDFMPEMNGTVLSGTLLYYESKECFLFDDLFYYKNEKVNCSYLQKCALFREILILHLKNHTSSCFFMFPLMSTTCVEFEPVYKTYSLKIVHATGWFHYMNQKKTDVFTVKSTTKSDIYEVNNHSTSSIAYIDTYVRSSYMNQLFDIPEKEIKMKCLWHEPFKKWIPVHPV